MGLAFGRLRCLALGFGKRPRLGVPKPILQITRLGAADIQRNITETGGNRSLPDARIGQIGKYPKITHLSLL